ncbi:S-norcoclaurine synthase 1 [Hibiscus syriacus]|uniref:S-norcoclaurine synthase 1 n=1 Tax=Hibiscus syriacus TaxID=106335 RepID=A0A6A2ZCD3_HIBSY|nr:S-norcoclaurine synthase 1-like [Hibiscus syriacus]KAE8689236.1 S-norcoclaurine synthase 1 [Hibiscus syriacus]
METKVQFDFRLGGDSIPGPVENVQALASKNLKKVSSRYIRSEIEFDAISMDESFEIPVIDMSKLDDDSERRNLHLVCRDWGFFQLINHGVANDVIEKMKIDLQEFFKLPLKEKMAFSKTPDNPEGYGQDIRASDLEDQKLEWKDILLLVAQPINSRNMRFWPTNPRSFRESFEKYTMALHEVMIRLVKLVAENLGTDPEAFSSFFEDGRQVIRMNYYPPCAEARKVLGAFPHSDSSGLTLLIQANEVEGLQIKRNEKWIPVKPIPGAFIVNIGDVIEIMSNGEYKSIEHRVVVNEDKERLSIASLHYPKKGTQIVPLPDVTKTNKVVYKSMPLEEFLTVRLSQRSNGKRLLDQIMKL